MKTRIEQLEQLAKSPVWDGNLISKTDRDELVKAKYVDRISGWNFLTKRGIKLVVDVELLKCWTTTMKEKL